MDIKDFIDKNEWDFEINVDNINIKIDGKYLIHYCLIYRKFDLIKNILKIDKYNFEKIEYRTLLNIVYSDDYITILKLLEIVNFIGKKYILNPRYELDNEWIIYFFMQSNIIYIKSLLKYKNIIYWNYESNGFYPLRVFLNKYYNQPITPDIKYVFNIILKKSADILNNPYTSIILEACLVGFNKYILNKLIKANNKLVNKMNGYYEIPLLLSLNNIKLFDFLIKNNANYNYSSYHNNILMNAIITGNIYVIKKLLTFDDLNLSYYNNNRDYACLIIFVKYKDFIIPDEIKIEILKRTENINLQNIFGNTALHYILLNEDWIKYENILVNKHLDIFIKNKNDISPINYIKNIDNFLLLTSKSYVINFNPKYKNNKSKHLFIKDNKFKLYNIIKKKFLKYILKNNINPILLKIKKYILKYKESVSELSININFINYNNTYYTLFFSSPIDILIYQIYLVNKYDCNIPILNINNEYNYKETKLITNNISADRHALLEYFYENAFSYINFESLTIYWYDKNNHIISNNLNMAIQQCKKQIINIHLTCISDSATHSNCIIINKNKKHIIRFDPQGIAKNILYQDNLDSELKKYFSSIFDDFIYLSPSDYMNTSSFQILSNEHNYYEVKYGDIGGFCLAWTFLFFELYMSNLHVELSKLIEISINKIINSKGSFTEYIRKYTAILVNFKINFLKKINFPQDRMYKPFFDLNDNNYIYKYINIELEKIKNIDI